MVDSRVGFFLVGVTCLFGLLPAQGFIEVAASAGLAIPGNNWIVNMDRGACFADFDGDGDQDLVVGGLLSAPFTYYRNDGNGVFTDLSAAAGLGAGTRPRACLAADIENDGDLDLFVAQSWAPNLLFVNDGAGHFIERGALAGVNDAQNAFAATFGDFDRDGFIDLFVGNNGTQQPLPSSLLYRNNGNGTFTDVTAVAGVGCLGGVVLATMFYDYDGDLWPDLYVANDWHNYPGWIGNKTFRNNGNGTFTDVSVALGTSYFIQAMGNDIADAFNDGGWDLYVTNVEQGHLFHEWNSATQHYDPRASTYALQAFQLGWASHFFDFDNDGWQDLYVNHSEQYGSAGVNTLFRNPGTGSGGGGWPQISNTAGLSLPGKYFTSTIGDVDDDGRIDILQLRWFAAGLLYRNTAAGGHWLKLSLTGTKSNRAAIGAVVTLSTAGLTQRQMVRSGAGFMSGNDLRLNFGLGAAMVADRIEIRWPSGALQVLTSVSADQILHLSEPDLKLTAPPLIGTSPNLSLSFPGDGLRPYVMALSLAAFPGVLLPDGRIIPLSIDALATLTLTPGNFLLPSSSGLLSPQGSGSSPFNIPGIPSLAGLTVYATAVSGDPAFPSGIRTILAPALAITLY